MIGKREKKDSMFEVEKHERCKKFNILRGYNAMHSNVYTLGCIGCGNMGSAILKGLASNDSCKLIAFDKVDTNFAVLQEKGVEIAENLQDLVTQSDIIVLAVKPWLVIDILAEIRRFLTKDKVILSIAAGVSMSDLQEGVAQKCPVIRCMPNTPAIVGAGIYSFCFEDFSLAPELKQYILTLFESIGTCVDLAESDFAAFTALIGSGPAYVFHFMNAMVQAGVTQGFSRHESKKLEQALFHGSVLMAEHSPHNITELRDQVCSPGGVAIAGVNHLEKNGLSGQIVEAVSTATLRAKAIEES